MRRKAAKDYEKVLRDIETAKGERERFEKEDQPEYRRWLHASFGQILTELREIQQKLYEAQCLVDAVEDEYFFGRHRSMAKAYAEVKRWREAPPEPEPMRGEEEEEEYKELNEEGQKVAEEIRQFFEEMFGEEFEDEMDEPRAERNSGGRGRIPGQGRRAEASEADHRAGRIKDLYRQLVRRLHPDHAGELSQKHVEWWHQTQEAYQRGDIERLELIFTLSEIERGGTNEASVGLLMKITGEFKRALKAIRSELAKLRLDPAWKFSLLENRSRVYAQTLWTLERERDQGRELLAEYEGRIAQWEETLKRQPPRKSSRNGPRKRPPIPKEEFLF